MQHNKVSLYMLESKIVTRHTPLSEPIALDDIKFSDRYNGARRAILAACCSESTSQRRIADVLKVCVIGVVVCVLFLCCVFCLLVVCLVVVVVVFVVCGVFCLCL